MFYPIVSPGLAGLLAGLASLWLSGCTEDILMPAEETPSSTSKTSLPESSTESTQEDDATLESSSHLNTATGPASSDDGTFSTLSASSTSDTSGNTADTMSSTSTSTSTSSGEETTTDEALPCEGEFTCVSPAPEGWFGPFSQQVAVSGQAAQACPSNYPTQDRDLFAGLKAEPAKCDGCTFTAKAPTCGIPLSARDPSDECGLEASEYAAFLVPNECTSGWDLDLESPYAVRFHPPAGDGAGTCQPATPGKTELAPTSWDETYRYCAGASIASDRACAGTDTCWPRPLEPSTSQLCIVHEGALPCPDGPYATRALLYRSVADDRSCGQCVGSLVGAKTTCSVKLEIFDQPAGTDKKCASAAKPLVTRYRVINSSDDWSAQCDVVAGFEKAIFLRAIEVAPKKFEGSCTVNNWKSQGAAEASEPTTVCCTAP